MNFDSIKAETGPNVTTGDPGDQTEIVNRKIARATNLMTPPKTPAGLGSMLKVSAIRIRKKKSANS